MNGFGKLSSCFLLMVVGLTPMASAIDGSWDAVAQLTGTQDSNGWHYLQRQRPPGVTVCDLVYADGQWRTTDYATDPAHAGWVGQYGSTDGHPGMNYDVIRRWTAPAAMTVNITGRVYKVDTSGGAGIIASVEKNGTCIWSKTLDPADSVGYATDSDLSSVSLNTGDTIAFVVDDNGTYAADSYAWDPVINTVHDAFAEFSGTQGVGGWFYQEIPIAGGAYTDMCFLDSEWRTRDYTSNPSNAGWEGNYDGSGSMLAEGHPGYSYNVMRTFAVTASGTIGIGGSVYKLNLAGGAINASVDINGTVIWAKTVAGNDSVGYSTDTDLSAVNVSAGDFIHFVVNDNGSFGGNWYSWDPTIAYTAASSAKWITAWGTAMEYATSLPASNFSARFITRVTLPGSQVRIRLSNRYGTSAITFNQVFVGPVTTAPCVSSNTQVHFGGSASVQLQAGQEIMSDPVPLSVNAQDDLAVSLYVPGTITESTCHLATYVTQYWTALDGSGGNHAAETTTAASYFGTLTNNSTMLSWVEGVDVLDPNSAASAVVAIGDSITDGAGLTINLGRWTDILGQRMQGIGAQTALINKGISGNTVYLSTGTAQTGEPAITRVAWDVQGLSGVKYCILFEGTNDIIAGASADMLETKLAGIVTQLHGNNFQIKVIGGTILPRKGADSWTSGMDAIRDTVNAWIRSSGTYDGVIDFDPVMENPSDTEALLPAYANSDHTHPNYIGYAAMGAWIDPAYFQIENAVSVSVGSDNNPRVLWNKPGGTAVVQTLSQDGSSLISGSQQSFGPYGPFWLAKSVTVGSDNIPHLLWVNNGSWYIWTLGNTGVINQGFTPSQYTSLSGTGWFPVTMAEDQTDLKLRILMQNVSGAVSLITLDPTNWSSFTVNNYGTSTGWTPVSMAVGADDKPRILMHNADGSACVWQINNDGTSSNTGTSYGPYLPSQAVGLAVGADNDAHVLWDSPDGSFTLRNFDTSGTVEASHSFATFSAGFGRAIGSGGDSNSRVLLSGTAGNLSLWDVNNSFDVPYVQYWPAP